MCQVFSTGCTSCQVILLQGKYYLWKRRLPLQEWHHSIVCHVRKGCIPWGLWVDLNWVRDKSLHVDNALAGKFHVSHIKIPLKMHCLYWLSYLLSAAVRLTECRCCPSYLPVVVRTTTGVCALVQQLLPPTASGGSTWRLGKSHCSCWHASCWLRGCVAACSTAILLCAVTVLMATDTFLSLCCISYCWYHEFCTTPHVWRECHLWYNPQYHNCHAGLVEDTHVNSCGNPSIFMDSLLCDRRGAGSCVSVC